MDLKIINSKLGIVSCSYEELNKQYKERNTVVFVYSHSSDWIVFNEDYKDFEVMVKFAQDYLEFDNEQKKAFYDGIPADNPILGFFHKLDCVARIRRYRERSRRGGQNERDRKNMEPV